VICSSSLQGQLLDRVYGGDLVRLDHELEDALDHVPVESVEPPDRKEHGKRTRYPIARVPQLFGVLSYGWA
jgi:hypothetical protein